MAKIDKAQKKVLRRLKHAGGPLRANGRTFRWRRFMPTTTHPVTVARLQVAGLVRLVSDGDVVSVVLTDDGRKAVV